MSGRLYDMLAIGGACLILLLLLDIAGRLLPAADDASTAGREDPRAELPAYRDASYDPAAYWREFDAARRERYEPYVIWRQRAFDGRLIDIDADGNRSVPASRDVPGALRVWMLGGSVTWGFGAPDQESLPNELARLLNRSDGLPVKVRNLGEIGFVSTQELVLLLRELQHGRHPDLVIFVDGANDAPAAALWPEPPGTHMNFYSIRDRFERPQQLSPWLRLFQESGLKRLASSLAARLPGTRPVPPPWDAPDSETEIRRRGQQAAAIWLRNQSLTSALARRFGFEAVFVLQPALMVGRKPLERSEQAILAREQRNDAKRLSMAVYREMRSELQRRSAFENTPARVSSVDAVDLFADHPEPLYIDYVHLAGPGNRILAARIAEFIADQACKAPKRSRRLQCWCKAACPGAD